MTNRSASPAGTATGIPAKQRRISWHAPPSPVQRADPGLRTGLLHAAGALLERFAAMTAVPAAQYLLVPQSGAQGEWAAPNRMSSGTYFPPPVLFAHWAWTPCSW
ncbi:hypothetical protein ACFVW1_23265 [Streptomyces olivochromogenes]|uniref:hypothetical protein n=1 Tax=Streptomyces olivochromogenes TaxID=1963 RepID=UPI0036D9ECEF